MYEVLVDLPIQIPREEVYRYMGYPPHHSDVAEQIKEIVEEEIAAALPLIHPKATYLTAIYNASAHGLYIKEGMFHILGDSVQQHLAKCTKATLFTCTIGGSIEPYIDTYFKAGEFTRAVALDAIGSAAVEFVADTLNHYLHSAAHRQSHSLVSRFSPGYGDWSLACQRDLIDAAGGPAIGIHVTSSSLLIPRKSVSGIIGWIPGLDNKEANYSPCDMCLMPRCKNPICKGGHSR